jgi:hypothetical protein
MKLRRAFNKAVRRFVASLPQGWRFAVYRSMVDCDPKPSSRLVLKIAETQEELEACFTILHDAYVDSGFMKPHPSGMRVTIYHALPTTTTLCAKWDGQVVGTLSLIRESPFGFPLQQIFDLDDVRAKGGALAEVSALAIHPKFRNTGGTILFPLMKFMYEYCHQYFDTRHLLIAVNPSRIELYESLLGFTRLTANVVDEYDFANGAPAVGATLDLEMAPASLKRMYAGKGARKNLYHFFMEQMLPNIQFPSRRYYTTSDPVLTPELLNHFFNVRTDGFASLDKRRKVLLHAIYVYDRYQKVLPPLPPGAGNVRCFPRFSVKCPAEIRLADGQTRIRVMVIDVSTAGFQVKSTTPLPMTQPVRAVIKIGEKEVARLHAAAVRLTTRGNLNFYGLRVDQSDYVWRKFVRALEHADTHSQLDQATSFME